MFPWVLGSQPEAGTTCHVGVDLDAQKAATKFLGCCYNRAATNKRINYQLPRSSQFFDQVLRLALGLFPGMSIFGTVTAM